MTPQPPQPLDLLGFPLWGSRLIEASAGTGKTWTIAALMLRLVLGHGQQGEAAARTGFGRPLAPGEVLVMTFTRAATRELADRIRSRLQQAARCFRGICATPADDAVLQGLLAACPEGPAREAAAGRLALAAESMDEAAVHTLDAWCQRMLREHAFDSGSLFDEDLLPAEAELLQQATRDHWRCHVLPLDDVGLAAVSTLWPRGPDDLARDIAALDAAVPAADTPQGATAQPIAPLGPRLAALLQDRASRLAALKREGAMLADELRAWLHAEVERPGAPWQRNKLRATYFDPWMQALSDWAGSDSAREPSLSASAWARLTPQGLADAWKGPGQPPVPAALEPLHALRAALRALPDPAPMLRLHALAGVRQRLQALKAASQRLGFADLLQRLDRALDDSLPGRQTDARRLRQRILAQYPVAIVDEFQDTSPLQLRILDRLYRVSANDPSTALLLIGDPKQSIYAFRGADIRSYLQARQATAGRHHMLQTNFRSTVAAVEAVNALFGQAEDRPGAGAFGHRSAQDGSPLPFVPVRARGLAERLAGPQGDWPALQIALAAAPQRVRAARRTYAAHCAAHVVQLLQTAQLQAPGREPARLQPGDIAVLVRSRTEAALVRRALQRRGVPSVYLSDQDSVFASAEAADLLRLLQAVAHPRDTRLARAALATRLLGLPLHALQRLAQDDDAFDAQVQQLHALHAIWRRHGVLAMLRQALHRLDLPRRLLGPPADSDPQGERRLTNLLHLAELLQQASLGLDGEQALLRWLAAQVDGAGTDLAAEEQVLRLESDAARVQVVTVHKSKGLEYPVVCLPFATGVRAEEGQRGWLRRPAAAAAAEPSDALAAPAAASGAGAWVGADALAWIDLAPDAAAIEAADAERLREDLRLLYVALTRARHHTWVGAAVLQARKGAAQGATDWHRSALGALLTGPAPQDAAQIAAAVQALTAGSPTMVLRTVGPDALPGAGLPGRWQPPAPTLPLHPPLVFSAAIDRDWTLASFTALVREVGAAAPMSLVAAQVRDDESPAAMPPEDGDGRLSVGSSLAVSAAAAGPAAPAAWAAAPWHRFPRGTGPGNLLHELLELLARQGFGAAASASFAAEADARCARHGLAAHADAARQWLQALVQTPLPPWGVALPQLQQVTPEMEFWLPNPDLDTAALDALCQRALLPGVARPALPPRRAHGMLMGFVDLVVQHEGRWWVLDHKSNALGDDDAAYAENAMQATVAAHRYDVQAAIYLLALHRLLRQRLGPGYDPATQLGGAVFLFLRGLRGPRAGCVTLLATPSLLQALDALLPPAAPAPAPLGALEGA